MKLPGSLLQLKQKWSNLNQSQPERFILWAIFKCTCGKFNKLYRKNVSYNRDKIIGQHVWSPYQRRNTLLSKYICKHWSAGMSGSRAGHIILSIKQHAETVSYTLLSIFTDLQPSTAKHFHFCIGSSFYMIKIYKKRLMDTQESVIHGCNLPFNIFHLSIEFIYF